MSNQGKTPFSVYRDMSKQKTLLVLTFAVAAFLLVMMMFSCIGEDCGMCSSSCLFSPDSCLSCAEACADCADCVCG